MSDVELVEPRTTVVEVDGGVPPAPLLVEPERTVVELVEEGQRTLYVVEPTVVQPADLTVLHTPPYRHEQTLPARVWHVVHNLGYDPAAHYVVDGSGTQSWPDRHRVSDNEFTLDWGQVLATGTCLTR